MYICCLLDALVHIKKATSHYLWISLTHAPQLPRCFEQLERETFIKWQIHCKGYAVFHANHFFFVIIKAGQLEMVPFKFESYYRGGDVTWKSPLPG